MAVDDTLAIAVGGQGTVLMWDGGAWATSNPGVSVDLTGVWATSYSNVWVSGGADILHWNGAAWSVQVSDGGLIVALAGGDGGLPWAIDESGSVFEFDGTSWARTPGGGTLADGGPAVITPMSTWGTSQGDYWVLDPYLGLVHFTGGNPSYVDVPFSGYAIYGTGETVLVAGQYQQGGIDGPICGEVGTWDGGALGTAPLACDKGNMPALWSACSAETWIAQYDSAGSVICRWTGSDCVYESLPNPPSTGTVSSVSGSAHHVWAVGQAGPGVGAIFHANHN